MRLDQLHPGQCATVAMVGGKGAAHRHLLDMGLTPGVKVTLRRRAVFGDPLEISLRGYTLTLRRTDAAVITLKEAEHADHCAGRKSE